MEETDHEYTKNIICPHCGDEDKESDELEDDYGTLKCFKCKKHFNYDRYVDIKYSTMKEH